jgi:hypothetical protein
MNRKPLPKHFKQVHDAVKRSVSKEGTPEDTMLILRHVELAKLFEDSFHRDKAYQEEERREQARLLEELKNR